MKNLGNLMKQAQQMQQKMGQLQSELAGREIEVSAGGGAVKVKINGKQEIISIKINPDVVDLHDVAGLEEVVTLAVNNAIKDSQSMVQKAMSSITGGMNIPGLF